jgi:hypothetical protein
VTASRRTVGSRRGSSREQKSTFPAKYSRQLVAIPEEAKSDVSCCLRLEIGQDINVAASRIKVIAEHGTEHAQANDVTVAAESYHAVTVELDWQFLDVGMTPPRFLYQCS